MARLITIATFASPDEAEIVRGALAAQGIAAFLEGEFAVGNLWHLGIALGGVKLQVAEQDEVAARAILDAGRGESPAPERLAEVDAAKPARCASCGAATELGFDVCWKCGASLEQIAGRRLMEPEAPDAVVMDAVPIDETATQQATTVGSPNGTGDETDTDAEEDIDHTPTTVGDALATRAWRAAVLGLCVFLVGFSVTPYILSTMSEAVEKQEISMDILGSPLTLYSGWLLLRLSRSKHPLSSRGKRHCIWALIVDSPLMCLYAWFFKTLF